MGEELGEGSKTILCRLKGSSLEGKRKRLWKRSSIVLGGLRRLGKLQGGHMVAGAGKWQKFLKRRG